MSGLVRFSPTEKCAPTGKGELSDQSGPLELRKELVCLVVLPGFLRVRVRHRVCEADTC